MRPRCKNVVIIFIRYRRKVCITFLCDCRLFSALVDIEKDSDSHTRLLQSACWHVQGIRGADVGSADAWSAAVSSSHKYGSAAVREKWWTIRSTGHLS